MQRHANKICNIIRKIRFCIKVTLFFISTHLALMAKAKFMLYCTLYGAHESHISQEPPISHEIINLQVLYLLYEYLKLKLTHEISLVNLNHSFVEFVIVYQ